MSKFEKLLNEAVTVALELRKFVRPRLSAKGFLTEALAIANCDEARLDELERQLENPHASCDAIKAFLRRIVHAFRESNWPRPCPDPMKLLRSYGSESAHNQISEMRSTIAELQAVACRQCAAKFPDAFGVIENWPKYEKQVAELRDKLSGLYDQMRSSVTTDDLLIDPNAVSPDERRRGLARVSFRRCPDLVLGMPDWPTKIVAAEMNNRLALAEQSAAA